MLRPEQALLKKKLTFLPWHISYPWSNTTVSCVYINCTLAMHRVHTKTLFVLNKLVFDKFLIFPTFSN